MKCLYRYQEEQIQFKDNRRISRKFFQYIIIKHDLGLVTINISLDGIYYISFIDSFTNIIKRDYPKLKIGIFEGEYIQ